MRHDVHLFLFINSMCHYIHWPILWNQKKVTSNLDEVGRDEIEEHLVVHINPPPTYIFVPISLILYHLSPQLTEISDAMEACFLNSNSFTKTLELVPSIKAKFWDHPTRYARQRKGRKFGTPLSVSCKLFNFYCISIRSV